VAVVAQTAQMAVRLVVVAAAALEMVRLLLEQDQLVEITVVLADPTLLVLGAEVLERLVQVQRLEELEVLA
jgi:hypothetical protein